MKTVQPLSDIKRTEPFKCQRCGLCCQNNGDFAFDFNDTGADPYREDGDCSALIFEGKIAICKAQHCKREVCENYPDGEWCEREKKEKGLWKY